MQYTTAIIIAPLLLTADAAADETILLLFFHYLIGLINISKDIELACLNLNQLLDLQTMSGKDVGNILSM